MITRVLVTALLALVSAPAHGQLVLNASDSWTYRFTSLPGLVMGQGPADFLGGFHFSLSDYEVGSDLLRIEMFENSLGDAPICSELLDTMSPVDSCAAVAAWADFQGVVLFTMLSGSASLEGVTFYHQSPVGMSSWQRHELMVTPVPEPSTMVLAGLGALAIVGRRTRQRYKGLGCPTATMAGAKSCGE